MKRPRLLDLFSGAGGCSVGYARAGFDVVGVDYKPMPRYPYEFHQGDALEFLADYLRDRATFYDGEFHAIHASPPCQAFSLASTWRKGTQAKHPDLVDATRTLLEQSGLPWVMENVEGSPLRRDVVLCGEMFGLRLHRHRVFETGGGVFVMQPRHQPHRLAGAIHNCDIQPGSARQVAGNYANHADASDAMGIDWMTRKELAQAIPPTYTEFIGVQLIEHLRSLAA